MSRPNFIDAMIAEFGTLERAIAFWETRVGSEPVDARLNPQVLLNLVGREEEAFRRSDEMIAVAPQDPRVRFNRGWHLIRRMNFAEGFALLENGRALNTYGHPPLNSRQPVFDRERRRDGPVILVGEGGLGDEIINVRWARHLARRHGAKVIVASQPGLASVIERMPEVSAVIQREAAPGVYHRSWMPSMSGVHVLGLGPDELGSDPYLTADPEKVRQWRERIEGAELLAERETNAHGASFGPGPAPGSPNAPGPTPASGRASSSAVAPSAERSRSGWLAEAWRARPWRSSKARRRLRVGVRWAGNPQFEHQQFRKFPPETVLGLRSVENVRLFSFQRDNDLMRLPADVVDLAPALRDWEDTAAALSCMDVVVSSCTSVAHMSAALGIPTWVVVPVLPYYVWATPGDRSPWYASVRLFRQTRYGDWSDVSEALSRELIKRRAETGPDERPTAPPPPHP